MVLCVKVKKEEAEETRQRLLRKKLLATNYRPATEGGFVFFAVGKKIPGMKHAYRQLDKRDLQPQSIKEALREKLSAAETENFVRSFDFIGDVIVIEVPPELRKRERLIAKTLLAIHKNARVVAAKASEMKGVYRVRELRVLTKDKNTETTYSESGVRMKLDVATVYFSPRLVHERQRIAGLTKPGERILALFAGVGPFPLVIAKKKPETEIIAIELNPHAVKYLKQNVKLNKLEKSITPMGGDVAKIVPEKFRRWADRTLMPLPKGAEKFLDAAIAGTKPGGTVHFYQFSRNENPFEEAENRIKEACANAERKCRILFKRVVRPFAPRVSQIVIDFRVE